MERERYAGKGAVTDTAMYPLSALGPSPRNTRPGGDDISALADSILQTGIVNPIIARPNPLLQKSSPPDVPPFEVVCGHRRLEAAKKAGVENVPVILMDLSDDEADVVRITENLQRRDLHPLDEAEAFARLATVPGYGAGAIAEKVGKSATYVAQRIRLVELPKSAQKAMRSGELSLGAALLLARLPNEKVRASACRQVLSMEYRYDLEDVRRIVEEQAMRNLSAAPFDTQDAGLYQEAGSCGDCPKRTGNDLVLFPDIQKENVCTDAGCFSVKAERGWKRRAELHEASSGKVLAGKDVERMFEHGGFSPGSYVNLSAKNYADPKTRTWRQLLSKRTVAVVLARNPHTGEVLELADRKEVEAQLREAGIKVPSHDGGGSVASPRERQLQREERIEQAARAQGIRAAIGAVVEGAEKQEHSLLWEAMLQAMLAGSWHDVIAEVVKRRGWYEKGKGNALGGVLEKRIKDLTANERRGLTVELAITKGADGWDGRFGKALTVACRAFKVDPAAHVRRALLARKAKAEAGPKAKKARSTR